VQRDRDDSRTGEDAPRAPSPASFGAAAFIFRGNAMRYVNPAGEAMTGYSAREILGMNFWDLIHPDHREFVRQRGLARQRGESVPWHYEVKLLHRSGASRWVEFTAGVIEFEGQPAVLGTAIDITERKAADDGLREREMRMRALIENSSDVVLIADADLRLRYVGPSIERILGWRPDEMVGDDNLDRIHPDDRAVVRGAYAELLRVAGGRASATYRIRHRDGSWHWFESIGVNMLSDPPVAGIIINSRDVTDRVLAENAYRSLVDHSLQGLLIVQDLRIVFANPRMAEITGYALPELLALEPEQLRLIIHPDDREVEWRHALLRDAGEPAPSRSELRFMRRDGTMRWTETYLSLVEYRGRTATQVACLDITDRKRAEDEARLHQQELAHVLRRSTMGEMAAMFAHEVNQPLSAIISYAKGCVHRLRAGNRSPEALLTALDEIVSQAVRAGEIIRRLRRFVGKGELQRQPLNLNDLVNEVLHFVTAEAREHDVRLHVDLATDLPQPEGDGVQIEQVILNLLRNALEAIYEDPSERRLLAVRTRRVGGDVEVSVRDNGAGLRPDLAADVFEPFVTSKAAGLGMGLSICRSIVEAHGGRVWSSANPDRGMTFHFTLPLRGDAFSAEDTEVPRGARR
jgi:PAS domain S-box-containing protein